MREVRVGNVKSAKREPLWISLIRVLACMLLTIFVSMNLGYYLGQQSMKPDWHETPIEKLFVEYKN